MAVKIEGSMKVLYFVIVACALASSGCSTSPIEYQKRSSVSSAAVLGVATAAGAAFGHQGNDQYGAPVGAAAGLAAGAIYNKLAGSNTERVRAEAYEQGKRDARGAMVKEIWEKQAIYNDPQIPQYQPSTEAESSENPGRKYIAYEPGVYNGVKMLSHSSRESGGEDLPKRQ